MLSAVESPYGPGRPYAHHFAGQAIPTLLPPCPISSLPLNTAASMSAAKFARPHPKTRYNRGSLRNGLTSPRSKYIEQTDPVNLAVSQSSASLGLADANIVTNQNHSLSDNEVLSPSISSIYGTHKLPFGPTQSAGAVDAYQSLNYSTLYGRTPTIYGAQPIYQPHPLTNRNQLHHRPTYIPSQLDHYSTYLPSVSILPPVIPSTQISSASGNALSSPKTPSALVTNSNERSQQQQQQQQQSHLSSLHSLSSNSTIVPHDKDIASDIKLHQQMSSGTNANATIVNGKSVDFKVPCGKEGSLKHRILTRPYGEKDNNKIKSSIQASIVRSSGNNNAPTNFTKGSLIELANGELRPVEEMRTEDFILSSSKNPDLQLADTTVVNIVNGHQNNVVITFSYNNSKFEMEALPEHPFFVYGQGWASCHPEGSLQVFGLKCSRLQIGDVCISLTPRVEPIQLPPPSLSAAIVSHSPSQSQQHLASHLISSAAQKIYYNPYSYSSSQTGRDEPNHSPQNLSRKPQTVPTTATGTAVTSRTTSHFDIHHPSLAYAAFLNCPPSVNHHQDSLGHSISNCHSMPTTSRPLSQDGLTRTIPLHIIASSNNKSTGSPPILNRPPSNHTSTMFPICSSTPGGGGSNDDIIVDATLSKKRRWSAPDNICDDENCQRSGQKTCNH